MSIIVLLFSLPLFFLYWFRRFSVFSSIILPALLWRWTHFFGVCDSFPALLILEPVTFFQQEYMVACNNGASLWLWTKQTNRKAFQSESCKCLKRGVGVFFVEQKKKNCPFFASIFSHFVFVIVGLVVYFVPRFWWIVEKINVLHSLYWP